MVSRLEGREQHVQDAGQPPRADHAFGLPVVRPARLAAHEAGGGAANRVQPEERQVAVRVVVLDRRLRRADGRRGRGNVRVEVLEPKHVGIRQAVGKIAHLLHADRRNVLKAADRHRIPPAVVNSMPASPRCHRPLRVTEGAHRCRVVRPGTLPRVRPRLRAVPLRNACRNGPIKPGSQPVNQALATPSNSAWADLTARMNELKDLDGVLGLMEWEDETYAPGGARLARGPQVATVEAIRHQRLTDPKLSDLLAAAAPSDATQSVMVQRLQRRVDQATKVPERLVKALAQARAESLPAWQAARAAADFAPFAPHLQKLLTLTKEKAAALSDGHESSYDALLDEYEPEMTTATLQPILESLQTGLVPLVQALGAAEPPPAGFLGHRFDDDAQWRLTIKLLEDLGFDFAHGRQDRSTHPFTASVNERDVRVTTRIEESNLMSAISSTIHECGHALYEQGFDPNHYRTVLAAAPSMGIHESQSRLWENQVGLSRAFWSHYLPVLKAAFRDQLEHVTVDDFWRGINRVTPSMIRVDADEVTYNLHIVLRFRLERAMVAGELSVPDLPGEWNRQMQELLGVTPPDDAQGCLQDIHWAMGAFGYFPHLLHRQSVRGPTLRRFHSRRALRGRRLRRWSFRAPAHLAAEQGSPPRSHRLRPNDRRRCRRRTPSSRAVPRLPAPQVLGNLQDRAVGGWRGPSRAAGA